MNEPIPLEQVENRILVIRGIKVMIDKAPAKLYGVETKVLNQAVKRNIKRFPADFMFQLNWDEANSLRSQNVTLERLQQMKYRPYVFLKRERKIQGAISKGSSIHCYL